MGPPVLLSLVCFLLPSMFARQAITAPQDLNNHFHLSSREDLAVGFVAYDLQGYESLVL